MRVIEHFYPEVAVGGFSHVDSTIEFYTRINAILQPDAVVMDFGAGRGEAAERESSFRQSLAKLRGKVRKVVGVDVDPIVTTNPFVDEAIVIEPGANLPFSDATFDVIVSDWTFEHIPEQHVGLLAGEFARVLKPGGWVCARTPNFWGYVSLAARLVPESLHLRILRRAQPGRKECDVFPKHYCLNTLAAVRRSFAAEFEIYPYFLNAEPAYFGNSKLAWRLAIFAFKILPWKCGAIFQIFMKKK